MIFGLGSIFGNLLKPNPKSVLSAQLSKLIQSGTREQITELLSPQTDEMRQFLASPICGFIKQAIERGDTAILDVVVAECGSNNFSTLLHTYTHAPMGSYCTGIYDLLGYAMTFGTDEMTLHILSKPSVSPSPRHFALAREKGNTQLAEAFIQKGIRVEVAGEEFQLMRR